LFEEHEDINIAEPGDENRTGLEIAVIGMAGRFPGAKNIRRFWENLINGVESVTFFSAGELEDAGLAPQLVSNPEFIGAVVLFEGKEYFDAEFFGYTPMEAEIMDPQVRLLHECTWGALEDAGYNPGTYDGTIGVYAGASANFEWEALSKLSGKSGVMGEFTSWLFSNRDFVSTHVSYSLNLKGPSLSLQTACSTSLVAVDQACRGLLTGQCDIALAGGVNLNTLSAYGYVYHEGMNSSADGHCRSFDAEGKGFIGGQGVGVVVLKTLEDAVEDGDHIEAVIKGSAVNNDGNRKVGFAAPSIEGQAQVVTAALHMAEVDPETIVFVEAHGTATPLGDAVEINAMTQAYNTEKKGFCAVGSCKTNIGHADSAAGVISLIKAVLVLKQRMIPPTLHFRTPNPKIDFENSPFYVNTTLISLKDRTSLLRAGVNSFGIGGTNVHVVLEEWPGGRRSDGQGTDGENKPRLLLLSAGTGTALENITRDLSTYFKKHPGINLADAAYTLQVGRKAFEYRKMLTCSSVGEAVQALDAGTSPAVEPAVEGRPVIFMFSNHGSGYVNPGWGLYDEEPVFRRETDRCFEILTPMLGVPVKEILYPGGAPQRTRGAQGKEFYNKTSASSAVSAVEITLPDINPAEITRPIIFVFEYALATLLVHWGIKPAAMIGYGFGEYVAACLAGVFSLADALKLVVGRGRLIRQTPEGAVLHGVKLNKPQIPYISNVTGQWLTFAQAVDPGYWARLPGGTEPFAAGIRELVNEFDAVFVETGPGHDLSGLMEHFIDKPSRQPVIHIGGASREEVENKVGRLWLYGAAVDWQSFAAGEKRSRVSLPTYPFEGRRFWIDNVELRVDTIKKEAVVDKKEAVAREKLPGYRPPVKTEYAPPRTETEKKLAALWEEFFGFRGVGIHDDFFEMKGDSLKAVVVTSKIHRRFDVKVPLAEFFKAPTIEELAGYIDAAEKNIHIAVESVEEKEYYPLSSSQRRFYVIYRMEPESLGYNMPRVIPLGKGADNVKMELTFEQLIRRHESLRTSFQMIDEQPVQRVHAGVEFEIKYYSATGAGVTRDQKTGGTGKQKQGAIEIVQDQELPTDFFRPFDLSQAPLIRVGMLKESDGNYFLLLDMHHIISDGTSQAVLTNDFLSLSSGKGDGLPGLRLQFKDFSQWQNRLLQTGQLTHHQAYWYERFKGKLPVLNLPTDYPRPVVRDFAGDYVFSKVDKALTRRLNRFTRDTGTTLYMVLLTAISALLFRYTGQEDIIIGSPAAGRDHEDLQRIIGLLLGSLMMRNFPNGEKTFLEFLGEVKENTLNAYEYQAYPFEELLKKVDHTDAPGRNPVTDISLMVQNMFDPEALQIRDMFEQLEAGPRQDRDRQEQTEPGVSAPAVPINVSKVDLTFIFIEGHEEIFFGLEYCTALFKPGTVEQLAGRLLALLTGVVENPETSLADIDIIAEEEKKRIMASPCSCYPLSHPQKRIYYTEMMYPGTACNSLPFTVRYGEILDKRLLEQAVNIVIQKNDALRLRIVTVDSLDEPFQYIAPFESYNLEAVDLSKVETDVRTPMPLINTRLFYFAYLRFSEKESGFYLKLHHLVTDGWSLFLLINEITGVYEALQAGNPVDKTPKPSYIRYIMDEKEYLKSPGAESDRRFWHRALLPMPEEIQPWESRGDGTVSGVNAEAGEAVLSFPGEVRTRMHRYCKNRKTSVFKLVLSVLAVYVSRVTGCDDIVIAGANHNRTAQHHRQMMGMFVSTIPLRIKIDPGTVFCQFVDKNGKDTDFILKNHQRYPFNRLMDGLREESGVDPVYLLNINLIGHPDVKEDKFRLRHHFPGNEPTPLSIHTNPNNMDIHGVFELEWDYQTRWFSFEEIQRMHRCLVNILDDVLVHPEKQISAIELLSGEEKEQILFQFNHRESGVYYPLDKTVHQLFAEQSERTPDGVAVISVERRAESVGSVGSQGTVPFTANHVSLTYTELNERSNRLAHLLRDKGVGQGTIVGIVVEPSIEMLIGVIGILKAGGAYLPIDPDYPQDRIDYMLTDSNAALLLTSDELSDVGKGKGTAWGAAHPAHKGAPTISSTNLAYIIYTSGTTGRPKGVAVEHRNLVAYLNAFESEFNLQPDDTVIQQASFAFDAFVEEVYPILLRGGKLAVPARETVTDIDALGTFIAGHRVTMITCSPLLLSELNNIRDIKDTGKVNPLKSIRIFISGGDRLKAGHVDGLHDIGVVYNTYGPTETTVCATYYKCSKPGPVDPPIGKPIAGYGVYILDRGTHGLLPVGIAGELCISGPGAARGYLNRPELTAEKFDHKENYQKLLRGVQGGSFLEKSPPGRRRLYRTGDLARWLPDGNIEFLGRIDRQVKIRGFRVELGEIERRLQEHPHLGEVVVVDHPDPRGNRFLCAYYVVSGGGGRHQKEITVTELREFLSGGLPAYMIPAYFIGVNHIPRTAGGKVAPRLLPQPDETRPRLESIYVAPETNLEKTVVETWKEVLQLEQVGIDDNFFELGGSSLDIIKVNGRLKKVLNKDIPVVNLFRYTTIRSLLDYLGREQGVDITPGVKTREIPHPGEKGRGIAVIGMAGKFPGAKNIDEFWENLKNGVESICFFSKEELEAGPLSREFADSNYVSAKGALEDGDTHYFDAGFFGYTPREAELMDPQMRMFHESAWEALENAGYDSNTYEGTIGLYAGASPNHYWEALTLMSGKSAQMGFWAANQLLDKDFLCTRVSYKLNLKGPAYTVQTACSTSLVSIHLAAQAILNGECDMALAGGVTVTFPNRAGYLFQEGMVMSPDGHLRAFDAGAQGLVYGNGIGVVVLKGLDAALGDGDYIYAVIRGSAINNDGIRKVGFTAPSIDGQLEVIRRAREQAGVAPETVTYIETHGTATPLGDSVEVEALKLAFDTGKKGFCAIGSVKTNVGHLDAAAGAVGFIKTVLAIKHRLIPPSLHFKTANPAIDFENSPFYVNTALKQWEADGHPLRAGISSFGIGGTNAHVLLEEAPGSAGGRGQRPGPRAARPQLIVLSAKTETALDKMTENLANYLKQHLTHPGNPVNLANLGYTLQVGRRRFPYRRTAVCATRDETVEILTAPGSPKRHTYLSKLEGRPVVFMFPGLGSQYVDMGRDLYENEPVFQQEMDRCFHILNPILHEDTKEILYPAHPGPMVDVERINRSNISQPVLFAFEYALAKLLTAWGIRPQAMIGYSFGEYAAACLSGVFSLEDALKLVVVRGQLVEKTPGGAMLSVPITREQLEPLLPDELSLAIDNGPSCIAAGPAEAVGAFEKEMKKKRYLTMRLQAANAIHSTLMAPILKEFERRVAGVPLNKPQIPYISNLTGRWITAAEAVNPGYWASHLGETVLFADGIKELVKQPHAVFIEVGPGRDLSALMVRCIDDPVDQPVINVVRPAQKEISDLRYLVNKIGWLWLYGVTVDWREFHRNSARYRIPLPAYPFEGERFWIDGVQFGVGAVQPAEGPGEEAAEEAEPPAEQGQRFYRPPMTGEYVPPGSEVEKTLVSIWEDFFGFKGIGVRDDFFELGGDSLKAILVSSRIHRQLDVEVPLSGFFKHPTIEGLGRLIETSARSIHASIQPVEKKEYYSQSSAQRRLFFLDKFSGIGTSYNLPIVYKLMGKSDIKRYEEAFTRLINRHETLRSSFHFIDNEPVQIVHEIDETEFKIEYYNLATGSTGDAENKEESISAFIRPFDLSKAPLLRVGIIEMSTGAYLLLFDMHHIISDGTSLGILIDDFTMSYGGEARPPLAIQYKDFALWQKSLYESGKLKDRENYWLEMFSDMEDISPLDLPTDFPRPVVFRFDGDNHRFTLGAEMVPGIKELGSRNNATLSMTLLTAFNILLYKYTGREDIIVGSGIMGRHHADLQEIIGMFVNNLAMRNHPAAEKTCLELLEEVRENSIKAFENQDVQFEELVEKLNPPRDLSRNPLFDVLMVVQNFQMSQKITNAANVEAYPFESKITKFDLTLYVFEMGQDVFFNLEYSTGLFKPATIKRMADHFLNVIRQMVTKPGNKILQLDIMEEEERDHLLFDFNQTAGDYPVERTIHRLFAEQAERTPDGAAVVGQGTVTYGELDRQSDQLACLLREKGIGPDTVAAIMMGRSVEMITGLLGILKTGGAYLPIDPGYPEERIDYILRDSNARVLLKKSEIRISKHETNPNDRNSNDQNEIGTPIVLNFEHLNFEFLNGCPSLGPSNLSASNLAYVIYTSGTTGRPKGTLMEHRSLVNLCYWHNRYYGVTGKDNATQYASIGFDASVWEIFPYLLKGASLHIIGDDIKLYTRQLGDYFREHQITIGFLPTQFCRQFMEEVGEIGSLRVLLTGGDKLNRFVEASYRLYNNYGPTENTVVTTSCPVEAHQENIPIGKPIANAVVYILSGELQLRPVGIPGELCIGGIGLTRGYLNRPEITAEKFVPVSYSSQKIYKTGDLARWLVDGNIEFLGRVDLQVKIRGFRIEPGEIETRLSTHPSVGEAVVIDRVDNTGSKYLCAYVVSNSPGTLESAQLKAYLSRDLPDYMIPAYFVEIEAVPLTVSHKVDRKTLVQSGGQALETGVRYRPPGTVIEKKLESIWKELLGLEKIGMDDNFFELGGHSLKAVSMVSQIHKAFNRKIDLVTLYASPTICEIAKLVEQGREQIYWHIPPIPEKEYYPLSPAQKRLFVLEQMGAASTAYNISNVVRMEGEMDVAALEAVFKTLIRRHESLRTSFHMIEGEPAQRIPGDVEFEIEYLAANSAKDREEIVRNFIRPFDLSQAPLLRVGLIKLEEDKHILMADMHHIIADGVSMGLLVREFFTCYTGKGQLPVLRLQYKDFSGWINRRIGAGEIKNQETYWLNCFQDEIPVLRLPFDFMPPVIRSFAGSRANFQLEIENNRRLQDLALEEETGLFMVLLALYYVFLSKLGGQEDIVVGTPAAGRRDPDLEPVIGMFVNTLALRNFPAGEKSFREFLAEVKENSLQAFENQDYPFEDLVNRVAVDRDTGRNPLLDAMFVLQNNAVTADRVPAPGTQAEMETPMLRIVPYGHEATTSKFDITLEAYEFAAAGQVFFSIEYSTRLFKPETIERFIGHFQVLLSSVLADAGRKLRLLEIMSEEEKQRVLYDFNDTAADFPLDKTIHRLFAQQAERTPDGAAVVGQGTLTYRELDRQSDQLAYLLREKGIGPDTVAAIMMGRSIEMITGLLGILKAGGAYLPIDPEYPQERIDYILRDSNAGVLLTLDELLDVSKGKGKGTACCALTISSTNLAYIIYTSGTTGRPKGTLMEHRSLVNLCYWHNRYYGVTGKDNATQYANIGFDASVWEIFPYLIKGASLHIIADNMKLDIGQLGDYYRKHHITIGFLPTQFCQQFMGELQEIPALRVLLTGGDKLNRFVEASYRLYNNYGPTENTVVTTSCPVEAHQENIPIGKPIANAVIYILSRQLQLQPVGIPGELCIGGIGLTRGYLNRPDITVEKFINYEFQFNEKLLRGVQGGSNRSPLPGAFLEKSPPGRRRQKLYKTGDLARWLVDGNIEFLGRVDFQVKIRGFRIEPGEIEDRLLQYPDIRQVVVLVGQKRSGPKYLCAYFAAGNGKTLGVSEIRDYLTDRLPDYMVPAYFVQVEKIPLTAAGKIDRKALPSPEAGIDSRVDRYVAPGNDREKMIAAIWKQVLELEEIGVETNIFELGGNSIDIIKINARLKEAFSLDIPVVMMFRYPTVRSFAGYLDKQNTGQIVDRGEEKQEGKTRLEKLRQKKKRGGQGD
jgi:amino acid adenylation domain-containing protein